MAATMRLVMRDWGSSLVWIEGDKCEGKTDAESKGHEAGDNESPIYRLEDPRAPFLDHAWTPRDHEQIRGVGTLSELTQLDVENVLHALRRCYAGAGDCAPRGPVIRASGSDKGSNPALRFRSRFFGCPPGTRLSCAQPRRSGRVAEGGALLRRYGGECLHRGFESLLLRL